MTYKINLKAVCQGFETYDNHVIKTYSQMKNQIQKGRQSFTDTLLHLTASYLPENIPSTPNKKHHTK